ncbi:sensor histidine kinase [Clostridium hydrogeniformans]|uniref:sensor histidine kinase n=1 Tax=Clostridium hydrogeniformans TaxID=349933 RepID=UPI000690625E|nr:ATP-binding protein [Clostridium hydrogeniformans]
MVKLKNKITAYFVILSMILIALISIMANIFIKKGFDKYIVTNLENKKTSIITSLTSQYHNGGWDIKGLESIGVNALENGIIVRVEGSNKSIIWNARQYNSGMCESMIRRINKDMVDLFPKFQGNYIENNYDILDNGNKVGVAYIGYYGPYYYSESEILFFKMLNRILIIVAFVGIILAVFVGILISGSIVKPIVRVINTSKLIAAHNYKNPIDENTNIYEINSLIASVNYLAKSLDEQETLRKVLTKDIAHELRTPLTTIQSHLEAIMDGIWEPSKERLSSIHEEIQRLYRLIGDLDKLSKFEGEDINLKRSKEDIKDIFNGILINFEKSLKDKNIRTVVEGESYILNVDRDKMSQGIINIISNAIKYTNYGGIININWYNLNNEIRISIKDNGIGIGEKHLPYIFERFYRADESRARITGGSGIGLSITKAIVEAHNGEIEVLSNLEKGTEFIIKIPIA